MSPRLRFPIVLIHGYGDDPTSKIFSVWKAIEEMLEEEGLKFLIVKISPCGSIKERSKQCIDQIRDKYPGKTVHLIAHSMGGLNARDIAAKTEEIGFRVKTVTTYGTPHEGVPLIDEFLCNKPFDKVHKAVSAAFDHLVSKRSDHGALHDMSCKSTKAFNGKTPYNPEVRYFSWAGQILPFPLHLFSGIQVLIPEPSDGLINVSSAIGGKDFTLLGVLKGENHITLMGQDNVKLSLPYLAAVEKNEKIEVKPINNSFCTQFKRGMKGHLEMMRGTTLG